MKKVKLDFKSLEIKKKSKTIIDIDKKKNLIKPVSEAFKDIPAKEEIHKGESKYFN
ncbi:MAG: hypothetical protein IJ501_06015 [Bacilli bacterium]|nr:hypothetical protein [Bacilli bacterium]